MRILLIGEYSGVHSELQNQLLLNGFFVKTISDGDGYKNFKPDFLFINKNKTPKNKFLIGIHILNIFIGTHGLIYFLSNFKTIKKEVDGFDIVQLINPVALSGFGSISNYLLLRYLKKLNTKIFLCCLGDDYYWVKNNMHTDTKYKALKNLNFSKILRNSFSTKYTHGLFYKHLNNYAINISEKIIPGVYDYKRVYEWSPKCTTLIPIPISKYKIKNPIIFNYREKIKIFHGWQMNKENKKGNDIFDRVVKKLLLIYPEKIEYVTVKNVSYEDYINMFSSSHIAYDQCFSYDKGVNGLLLMASGIVTFTGLEIDAIKEYPIQKFNIPIGINATFNEDYLFLKLKELIENPSMIELISKNAIEFVKLNHEATYIANLYLKIWGIVN